MNLLGGNLLCLRSLAESVLESSGHGLQVLHTARTLGASSLCLGSPVVSTHFRERISAGGALALLNMKRAATTATARSVRLAGALSETGGTFGLYAGEERKRRRLAKSNHREGKLKL